MYMYIYIYIYLGEANTWKETIIAHKELTKYELNDYVMIVKLVTIYCQPCYQDWFNNRTTQHKILLYIVSLKFFLLNICDEIYIKKCHLQMKSAQLHVTVF